MFLFYYKQTWVARKYNPKIHGIIKKAFEGNKIQKNDKKEWINFRDRITKINYIQNTKGINTT